VAGSIRLPDTRLHLYCGIPIRRKYVTILQSAADKVLFPAYMLPWKSEDAFFSPLWLIIARGTKLARVPMLTGYHLFHWLLYMGARGPCSTCWIPYLNQPGTEDPFFIALFCTTPFLFDRIGIHGILPIRPEIFWLGLIQSRTKPPTAFSAAEVRTALH